MLAGAAAAKLGRKVTYQCVTTSTTTSYVTIDGVQPSEDEDLHEDANVWHIGARTGGLPTSADPEFAAINDVPPKPGVDGDSESSQAVAFQGSRQQNAGLARVGVVP